MTTPGLKRPSDFDMHPHLSGPVANTNGSVDNNKRRCTSNFIDLHSHNNTSPFKDPSKILITLKDDISRVIQDELHKTANNTTNICTNGNNGNINDIDDNPILSIRQTHLICEKLVKEVEQKLRKEYEAKFTNTLAQTTTNIALNLQQQAAAAAVIQAQQHHHHQQQHLQHQPHHLLHHQQQHHHHQHPQQLCTSNSLSNSTAASVAAAAAAASTMTSALNIATSNIVTGPVLLVSNLDEQLAIPENLFTLFGVFGDVIRVKILYNKKDNALIQMADAHQAQVAQGYLDKQKIFGKIMRVTRSKHQLVQMPREGNQSDAGLTKDFTNSPLHRFKFPGSRNYLNIYPPSNTLHISNIPANIEEDEIHKAFKEACGFDAVSFKFFPKDRKMAIIKFNSIEHATIALIKMHNFQISDGVNLRVSFSKSIMQQ